MEKVSVGCFEELLCTLGERQKKGENIFLLFCGDVDETTGKSWCPDCVKAEPVVDKVLESVTSGVFIRCSVGNRAMWKDPENVFRKHPKLQLTGVPTLLQWGTSKKLGDEECSKEDLVRMLFEDDD